MFRTKGYILKKIPIKNSTYVLHIFTKEFGVIEAWYTEKKNQHIDIMMFMSVVLKTRNSKNTLTSFSILKDVSHLEKSYEILSNVLEFFLFLVRTLPHHEPYPKIFDDIQVLYEKNTEPYIIQFITFMKLKIIVFFGIQKPVSGNFSDLLGRIQNLPAKDFILEKVSDKTLEKIDTYIDSCLLNYIHD